MRLNFIQPALAIVLVLAACSRDSTGPGSQINGQVQSISPPTLNVGGRIVTTTGMTAIMRGSTRISLAGIHEGEPVRVSGTLQADGTLMADKIDCDDNEVEFHGTIDSISAPDIFVAGHTVVTDSNTRITREENIHLTFDSLKVGDTVKVEGQVQTDSSVLAHRIRVGSDEGCGDGDGEGNEDRDSLVSLHGVIDSIVSLDLFIASHKIVTDSATIFERNDSLITLGDLAAGDTVEVKGRLQPDSSVLARKVEVGTGDHDGDGEGDGRSGHDGHDRHGGHGEHGSGFWAGLRAAPALKPR